MKYTLDGGRVIVRDGIPIAYIGGMGPEHAGQQPYNIGAPALLDRFAHEIVAALNAMEERYSETP